MNKQKAIDEFKEFCRSLCASDDKVADFMGRLEFFQIHLPEFQDNAPLINKKANELIEKYGLNHNDFWGDFRKVIADVFHREVLLKT